MLSNVSACFDLSDLESSDEVRAYVLSMLTQFITTAQLDVSKQSLVLEYAKLIEQFDFARAQKLADGTTWLLIFARQHCEVPRIAMSVGQSSYAMCHRMMRSWRVFEELADTLPRVIHQVQKIIHPNMSLKYRKIDGKILL